VLPRVQKPHNIRDLGPIDVNGLIPLVERVSDVVWEKEDAVKENDYAVFHHTQHIIFRFIPGNRDPAEFYSCPAWFSWQQHLRPVLDKVVAPFRFEKPVIAKAMLARLLAGHSINLHKDGAGSHERCHKIHVPLVSNEDATFRVGSTSCHLAVGRAYEVNNLVAHGARNAGKRDRVHLIFEVFEGARSQRWSDCNER